MLTTLPDWHTMRRLGISSSDLAAILGKSPYRSPRMVQREKLGQEKPRKVTETEDMRWGNIMEPYVVAEACAKLGATLIPADEWDDCLPGDVVRCIDGDQIKWMALCSHWPVARSTPDNFAVLDGEIVGLEAKTTGQGHKWKKGVPRGVWYQCQWHMLASGVRRFFVPVLFFGRARRMEIFIVDIHPAFDGPGCKAIVRMRHWWERHVEGGVPVPPMRLDIPDIDAQFAKTDGATVALPCNHAKLDDSYTDALRKRDDQKTTFDKAAETLRDVEARVREAIGSAMFATIEGRPGVTYQLFTDRHGKRRLRRKEKR